LLFQIPRNLPVIYYFKDHDQDAAKIANIGESHIPENVLPSCGWFQLKGFETEKIKNKNKMFVSREN